MLGFVSIDPTSPIELVHDIETRIEEVQNNFLFVNNVKIAETR